MALRLKTAFWNYDRTQPLIDRRITAEGCELDIEVLRPEITFGRTLANAPFDVCEISFSYTTTMVSKQDYPYALIPAFLSRAFRHSSLFIRTDRGIGGPEDLKGKTVGLQEYDMTAAVVTRGFLRDRHGVDPRDITWKVGELERTKAIDFPLGRPPEGVRIDIMPPDKSLEHRLLDGELDAVIVLRPLDAWRAGDPRVAPLFPDPIAAEKEWYAAAKHFPIMHAVGVRKSLLAAHPGLARRLYDAFLAAKNLAVADLEITQAPKVTLPWPHGALAEARALIGPDHWPYGLAANRRVLETQLRWSRLDGLQARPVTVDELFAADCLDT